MADDDKLSPPPTALATFRSGHEIALERDDERETILIRSDDGACVMRIEMGPNGPIVQLSGASLELAASSKLSLRAERLEVNAGSVSINAEQELALEASRGGVSLQASDDVDIRGERVRLNTPDLPMPLTWEEYRDRERKRADDDVSSD